MEQKKISLFHLLSIDAAMLRLKEAPFEDLGFAKLDHHRAVRQGIAEVIYGAGKTSEQIREIASAMYRHGQNTVLITRMSSQAAELAGKELPLQSGLSDGDCERGNRFRIGSQWQRLKALSLFFSESLYLSD